MKYVYWDRHLGSFIST